jgi:hypothetical protein
MAERLVDIPVTKSLRNRLKKKKGKRTYQQYLESLIGRT